MADVSGLPQEIILKSVRRASWASDQPWYEFLGMLRDFFLHAGQLSSQVCQQEEEEQEEDA